MNVWAIVICVVFVRKLLVELALKAYKKGREDEAKKVDADHSEFEKLADEVIG
ncbi:hypothetical protein ES704_02774 [subsurface metagenome]|jgi:hypothetical protein